MIALNRENITDYLKSKMPELDFSRPLEIIPVGEGSLEEEGDGYINYVFRVSDHQKHIILKQGMDEGRVEGFVDLPSERTKMEWDSMQIRKSIVPEYLPELYFFDSENNVFATEDVSYLSIARFQLNKNVMFPRLGTQMGDFIARSHFYTSEYYLDTQRFRKLNAHFMGNRMRDIIDNIIFITLHKDDPDFGIQLDPELASKIKDIVFDDRVVLERFKLRDLFMSKAETLLHGDYHTSNLFVSENEMKVIDMEYTFFGPAAFDIGYMLSNFISQYFCAAFRPFKDEKSRKIFQSYILAGAKEMYNTYCSVFFECWDKDAKPIYRQINGLKEVISENLIKNTVGFFGTANMFRAAGAIDFPEYTAIEDTEARHHAAILSVMTDRFMLLNREKYTDFDDFIDDLILLEKTYKNKIDWH